MDVFSTIRGRRFVWDSDKANSNLSKHGIPFAKAAFALFDYYAITEEDATDPDEAHETTIGMVADMRTFFVVHIERERETTRIISARHATPKERELYVHSR